MSLYSDKNKVHLNITDDGVGFDVDKVSKRKDTINDWYTRNERTGGVLWGGAFMIKSASKEGTQLKAALPKK